MLDVSENRASDRPPAGEHGPPQAMLGTISTIDFMTPPFTRTLYVGAIVPFLFAFIGWWNVLAPYSEQAQWVVARMAPIWPALTPQFRVVLETLGPGQAASYGFFCAALWMWPVICAVAVLREHARQRQEILPISRKETGLFIIVFSVSLFPLFYDILEHLKFYEDVFKIEIFLKNYDAIIQIMKTIIAVDYY